VALLEVYLIDKEYIIIKLLNRLLNGIFLLGKQAIMQETRKGESKIRKIWGIF